MALHEAKNASMGFHDILAKDQFYGNVNLICKSQCVCVYIRTTGPISMKFGMGILLNTGKVHSWVATPSCTPS